MHVEGILPANSRLVTLLSSKKVRNSLLQFQMVNKTSSFKTKLSELTAILFDV